MPDVRPGQPGGFQVALERVAVLMGGEPCGHDPGPGAQLVLERGVRIGVGHAEAGLAAGATGTCGRRRRGSGRRARATPRRARAGPGARRCCSGCSRRWRASPRACSGRCAGRCPVRSRSRSAARIAIVPCNPASASASANAMSAGGSPADVGLASDQPGFGVDDGRVGRPFGILTLPAEAGDGQHHQPRIDGGQGGPARPETVQHARPEVLHHHVAGGGEVEQPGDVGRAGAGRARSSACPR